jgi:hypothetical protein
VVFGHDRAGITALSLPDQELHASATTRREYASITVTREI